MAETPILKAIQVRIAQSGGRLFRNNVGILENKTGRKVRFGLAPGSSDLVGWKALIIEPKMVGKTFAQFSCVEVKVPGKEPTEQQRQWIQVVRAAGGLAFVAYDPDGAEQAWRNGGH